MKVALSSEAQRDLEEIGDYIALDSPRNAEGYVRELREACAGLGSMPRRFPVVGTKEGITVRRRVHESHMIFYSEVEARIEVLRILHGARDYMRLLFPN